MPKKYLKGTDGKFTGSIPNPPSFNITPSTRIPSIPAPSSPSASQRHAKGLPDAVSAQPLEILEPTGEFYVSSHSMDYIVPKKFESELNNGERLYFVARHMLFADSYGDNIAVYSPLMKRNEDEFIDLHSIEEGSISANINEANNFSEISEKTHNYFKFGGCASLAMSLHKQLPGSSLVVALGIPQDDPEDASAAHVFIMHNGLIYDSYGITDSAKYDYAEATGLDNLEYEILAMETDTESLGEMMKAGVFGNDFKDSSSVLIDKVASLIISKDG
jgi:hypothetical protein